MTWHPYTEPPQTVGRYEYGEPGAPIMYEAQWDGRHFRYAKGWMAGRVIVSMTGDKWRELTEKVQ